MITRAVLQSPHPMVQRLRALSRCRLVLLVTVASALVAAPAASAATQTFASGSHPTIAQYTGPNFNSGDRNAYIIGDPNGAWANIAGARWIGAYPQSNYPQGNYNYRATLTLPAGAINASVTVEWYADDCSSASINGASSGGCSGGFWLGSMQTMVRPLNPGANSLRFDVINGGSGYNPTGMTYRAVATWDVDSDADGIGDSADNCPAHANPGQADLDGDRRGDACDPDIDGDGVANPQDMFPRDAAESSDGDGDGVGDNADAFPANAAETKDSDGDGVGDNADRYPSDPSESKDSDGDGVGDNADAFPDNATESEDSDGDGVGDGTDNCMTDANEDQADLDDDTKGDACDSDIDGDGAENAEDAFPRDDSETKDTDGDLIGDNADKFPHDANESVDSDDDGVGDRADNCRTLANGDQADLDKDSEGDACDDDIDGDGVANNADNAPRKSNADQQDLDKDGLGDVIDTKVLPLAAEACKKEGFRRFYDGTATFKNQGDCVSFVATGSRNLMTG